MEKTYKILKLIIVVLLFAVLMAGAWVLYGSLSANMEAQPLATMAPEGTEKEKTPAPDFTVYDFAGNPHKLSDFQGKPVILNFWASWCGPCKSEMPLFQSFFDTYGEQIHFLMVNLTDNAQETKDSAYAYIAEAGHTFPVYYDTSLEAAMAYGVSAVPVTFFIDREGYFIAGYQGALNEAHFQQGVDMILN